MIAGCVIFRVRFPLTGKHFSIDSRETSAEDVTVTLNFFHTETNVASPFVFPATVFPFSKRLECDFIPGKM